jgi:hypothetical protein
LTDYLSRRGEILVLLLVVLLSITLMLLSTGRKDALARSLNDAALTPVQTVVTGARGLMGLRAQNDSLRAQLARARLDGAVMEEQTRELERMQQMLGFRETSSFKLLSARVIAREASRPGSGYKIDRGARDGVREELAVITPDGLVGKVVAVEPRSAWVRPLMARACKVSVRLERTRVDGILVVSGKGPASFVPLRQAAVGTWSRPGSRRVPAVKVGEASARSVGGIAAPHGAPRRGLLRRRCSWCSGRVAARLPPGERRRRSKEDARAPHPAWPCGSTASVLAPRSGWRGLPRPPLPSSLGAS